MGFLNKLFGGKKTTASILVNTQNNIFNIYSVSKPTDAQKMKASVYLCVAGIAVLNNLGDVRLRYIIDKLVDESRELTKLLSMRVKELSSNKEDLEKILAAFPKQAQVDESTIVNGLAAFEALYSAKAEKLMKDILSRTLVPPVNSAAFVVSEELFGKSKSENFLEMVFQFQNFIEELIRCNIGEASKRLEYN
jgi:hypothetical protein